MEVKSSDVEENSSLLFIAFEDKADFKWNRVYGLVPSEVKVEMWGLLHEGQNKVSS